VALRAAEKADRSQSGHLAAPFASITSPISGTVGRRATAAVEQVEGGGLLVVIAA
jgi:hypothetical protein